MIIGPEIISNRCLSRPWFANVDLTRHRATGMSSRRRRGSQYRYKMEDTRAKARPTKGGSTCQELSALPTSGSFLCGYLNSSTELGASTERNGISRTREGHKCRTRCSCRTGGENTNDQWASRRRHCLNTRSQKLPQHSLTQCTRR